jgi:phosphoribosylformylglycinamidine (FGAM) synthase PurS component
MPKTVEMIVSLKVPDNTAITTLQTLQKIGFSNIKEVKKSDYYKFLIEGDENRFRGKISKVDILVNANKHSCDFSVPKDNAAKILVNNINDDGASLLSTLKSRLGFSNIKKIEKGTLWSLSIEDKDPAKIAEKAAKGLLVNEHYQEYKVL